MQLWYFHTTSSIPRRVLFYDDRHNGEPMYRIWGPGAGERRATGDDDMLNMLIPGIHCHMNDVTFDGPMLAVEAATSRCTYHQSQLFRVVPSADIF